MANGKTSNDYREERKARLAKSAKKNAKKSHKVSAHKMSKKAKATLGIIVAVVVAAAITFGACYNTGVFERTKKINTVAGESYSAVEYEYYYRSIHNYYYSMAQQYDSYYGTGYGYYYTGYDYSKLPEDQEYPGDDYVLEDGSTPTWKEYLEYIALRSIQQYTALADMAEEAGFEVEQSALDEAMAQIDDLRTQIKEQADESGSTAVSFNSYLRSAYGKGMNEKTFLNIVERETIASEYSTYLMETTADGYEISKLEEVYKKDPSAYNYVDFRIFAISPETVELADDATDEQTEAAEKQAEEAAKKKADEMFGKITDEASFMKLAEEYATEEQKESQDYSKSEATLMQYTEKSSISSSFDEDTIEWLFNESTKANDKKMVEMSGSYYLFYMVKPSYRDDATLPVDVRHILYQFDDEATDAAADKEEQKAAADATATAIREADDPLAKFLELCESDSDDTSSASSGGLIQYLTKGQYVKAFEEWSLDESRQVGDVEVIETEYGYHVMYFDKAYTKPYWQINISQTLANKDLNTALDETVASDAYKVAENDTVIPSLNESIYSNLLETYYAGISASESETTA